MKRLINYFLLGFILFLTLCVNIVKIDYSKIEFKDESLNIFSSTSENITTEDISYDDVTFTVELDIEEFYYPCTLGLDATNEEVEAYKSASRGAAKKYYSNVNKQIIDKINITGYFERYISKYSNIVEFSFTKEKYLSSGISALTNLSSSNNIELISVIGVNNNKEKDYYHTPSLTDSLRTICAYTDYSNRNYTGEGVTVGILEAGIVDASHSNFVNTDLTIRDEWYYTETVSEHTTQMASLISGTNGIAPDVNLLSVEAYGSLTGEIDWLLENGVDVVNMSFIYTSNIGTYSDDSAYIDSIAYNYNVTFVAAVGNSGDTDKKVGNPALGYNVIAVGMTTKDDCLAAHTSYKDNGNTYKPDVMMPGVNIAVPGYTAMIDGTSASCAMTTGAIALVMGNNPALKVKPAMVKAIACASADKITTTKPDVANGYNEATGAGRINYSKFQTDYSFFSEDLTYNNSQIANFFNRTEMLYEGDTLTICLSWLAYANGEADDTWFTTYYFQILDSSNQVLQTVYCNSNNTLFIRFTIPEDGRYKMSFFRDLNRPIVNSNSEYVALDYRVD